MYQYLKKNQKKILAVFAAGLMIVFILPAGMGRFGNQGNAVVGNAGKDAIHSIDLYHASQQWDALQRQIYIVVLAQGQPRLAPLSTQLGLAAQQAIDSHREMYLLLQLEARRMGVRVSVDRLESLLQQRIYTIQGNQPVPYAEIKDPDVKEAIHQTVANFMLVQNAAERAASVVKISEPMLHQALATQWQRLTLDVGDYAAADFLKQVKEPTEKQLEEQFNKYAAIAPDSPTNPMGFGYRYPDRVKLQTIRIARAAVRDAVLRQTDEYNWKVKAYDYYMQHPERYQSSPEDKPTTSPSALGPGAPLSLDGATTAPSTRPTTRPFEEVYGDIHDQLVKAATDQLLEDIQKSIESQMHRDFEVWKPTTQAAASSHPSRAASPAVAYTSFAYLQKLAGQIEDQFHVRPTVADVDQFKGAAELAAIDGIGTAHLPGEQDTTQLSATGTPFATYAVADAADLMPNPSANPSALPLNKLSMAMRDSLQDTYYFRLTAVDPSHPAKSLADVRARVAADVKIEEAYDLAKRKADALLEAATKQTLADACKALGVKMVVAGPVSQQSPIIPDYSLPTGARQEFLDAAAGLLTQVAKSDDKHPLKLVELPQARKVAVIQLKDVDPMWDAQTRSAFGAYAEQSLAGEMRQTVLTDWFDYDALVKRLSYVPVKTDEQS